jgi:hypothetical protein
MLKKLPTLSTAALDVIAAQGAEGFYQVFGTDFIAGQRLGGSFMGIIDVRLKSSEAKSDFSASVKVININTTEPMSYIIHRHAMIIYIVK